MRTHFLSLGLCCCILALFASTTSADPTANIATVQLPSGAVLFGTSQTMRAGPAATAALNVRVFKGIRFAKTNRFEHSTLYAYPSNTALQAKTFAPACPQNCTSTSPGYSCARTISEDCLFLNVFAPSTTLQNPLPVTLYLHGGSYISGTAGAVSVDAAKLAARTGSIVVTSNYRLGVFGYIASPPQQGGMAGNFGFGDQLNALKWVQDNIQAFQGNPQQVTLAGFSAGAHSVGCALVSPHARGLVQRAVMHSPSVALGTNSIEWSYRLGEAALKSSAVTSYCGMPPNSKLDDRDAAVTAVAAGRSAGVVERVGNEAVHGPMAGKEMGAPTLPPAKYAQCLRTKVSVDAWLVAQEDARTYAATQDLFQIYRSFAPTVDGTLIPRDCMRGLAEGGYDTSIPLLLGTVQNEGTLFIRTAMEELPSGLKSAVTRSDLMSTMTALGVYSQFFSPQQQKAIAAMYPVGNSRLATSPAAAAFAAFGSSLVSNGIKSGSIPSLGNTGSTPTTPKNVGMSSLASGFASLIGSATGGRKLLGNGLGLFGGNRIGAAMAGAKPSLLSGGRTNPATMTQVATVAAEFAPVVQQAEANRLTALSTGTIGRSDLNGDGDSWRYGTQQASGVVGGVSGVVSGAQQQEGQPAIIALEDAFGDYTYSCGVRYVAREAQKRGGRVFLYAVPSGFAWTQALASDAANCQGRDSVCTALQTYCSPMDVACHFEHTTWVLGGDEAMFGQRLQKSQAEIDSETDIYLSMYNFVRTGAPANLWSEYSGQSDVWRLVGPSSTAAQRNVQGYKSKQCNLWDKISPNYDQTWQQTAATGVQKQKSNPAQQPAGSLANPIVGAQAAVGTVAQGFNGTPLQGVVPQQPHTVPVTTQPGGGCDRMNVVWPDGTQQQQGGMRLECGSV